MYICVWVFVYTMCLLVADCTYMVNKVEYNYMLQCSEPSPGAVCDDGNVTE